MDNINQTNNLPTDDEVKFIERILGYKFNVEEDQKKIAEERESEMTKPEKKIRHLEYVIELKDESLDFSHRKISNLEYLVEIKNKALYSNYRKIEHLEQTVEIKDAFIDDWKLRCEKLEREIKEMKDLDEKRKAEIIKLSLLFCDSLNALK